MSPATLLIPITPQTTSLTAPTEEPPLFPITIDHYHEMIKAGILTATDRVELIEGRILAKMPTNPPHHSILSALSLLLLTRLVNAGIVNDWTARIQMAVTIPDLDSEPEPDFVLARSAADRYWGSHPHPENVALLAEVSDSTLAYDRGAKLRLYAQAGIAVYWIVNVAERAIEVHEQPRGGDAPHYAQTRVYRSGEVAPLVLPGLDEPVPGIAVDELFPAANQAHS